MAIRLSTRTPTVGSSHPVQEHAFILFLAGPDGSSSPGEQGWKLVLTILGAPTILRLLDNVNSLPNVSSLSIRGKMIPPYTLQSLSQSEKKKEVSIPRTPG